MKIKIAAILAETLRDGGYQGENCDSSPDCKQKPSVFAPHTNKEAVPAASAGTAVKIDRLIRSKRRTLSLEITRSGEVIVRAPKRLSLTVINGFVNKKTTWLSKKLQQIKLQPHKVTSQSFNAGEKFLFLGDAYPLQFNEPTLSTDKFQFNNAFIIFSSDKIKAKKILHTWYQQQALAHFINRVSYYATLHQYNYKTIKLSNAKRRWGSCSVQGNLRFNWRLIMAPAFVIDYVVAHELAHIRELNHSRKFWRHVAKMIPDISNAKLWLKENGHNLYLSF